AGGSVGGRRKTRTVGAQCRTDSRPPSIVALAGDPNPHKPPTGSDAAEAAIAAHASRASSSRGSQHDRDVPAIHGRHNGSGGGAPAGVAEATEFAIAIRERTATRSKLAIAREYGRAGHRGA